MTGYQILWEEVFSAHTGLCYEPEELFATGDRCVFRWVGHRTDKYGNAEHYRGVDILRVRNGKVAGETRLHQTLSAGCARADGQCGDIIIPPSSYDAAVAANHQSKEVTMPFAS